MFLHPPCRLGAFHRDAQAFIVPQRQQGFGNRAVHTIKGAYRHVSGRQGDTVMGREPTFEPSRCAKIDFQCVTGFSRFLKAVRLQAYPHDGNAVEQVIVIHASGTIFTRKCHMDLLIKTIHDLYFRHTPSACCHTDDVPQCKDSTGQAIWQSEKRPRKHTNFRSLLCVMFILWYQWWPSCRDACFHRAQNQCVPYR